MVQDVIDGELVMGDDGTSRFVYGVTSGRENMYKISASRVDGFTCNESHILSLKYSGGNNDARGWKKDSVVNISVRDYLNLKDWEKEHLSLYIKGWGLDKENKTHNIDPYILGVWLGDGGSDGRSFSSADAEIISEMDSFAKRHGQYVRHIKDYAYTIISGSSKRKVTVVTNGESADFDSIKDACEYFKETPSGVLTKRFSKSHTVKREQKKPSSSYFYDSLSSLNLIKNKHIPECYLSDGEKNRLDLLAGLIDTDGYLDKRNKFEITQKNKTLAYNILDLARSLGFRSSLREKIAKMKRSDGSVYECLVYRVTIAGDVYKIPCRLKRKQACFMQTRYHSDRVSFKIESLGEGDYYGFAVDGNNLFLLADGTVVHNTYIAAAWALDRISMALDKVTGMQSKTDDDARGIFNKIVNYFVNLPHFFKPVYDTSQGLRPKKELRFFQTTIRGKRSEEITDGDELRSVINFGSSEPFFYDGSALYGYILDEFGKPQRGNVWDTWNIVRYCMDQDGRWVGKAFVTSTIEDLDVTGKGPKDIWKNSDQSVRDENGRTTSGLYRIFFGAHESTFFDEYGNEDVDRGLT